MGLLSSAAVRNERTLHSLHSRNRARLERERESVFVSGTDQQLTVEWLRSHTY